MLCKIRLLNTLHKQVFVSKSKANIDSMVQTSWASVAWRIPAVPTCLFSLRRNSTPRGGKDYRQRWITLLQLHCSSFCLVFAQLVSVTWMFSAIKQISQFTFEIFVVLLYKTILLYAHLMIYLIISELCKAVFRTSQTSQQRLYELGVRSPHCTCLGLGWFV